MASTKDLKRVLTLKDLIGVAVGQVIGAGIMSLMGVAIGLTGRSVPISFLLAAVVILIGSIPTIIVCSTVRLRGGMYTMAALLSGKGLAGFLMFVTIITNVSLSMFALSFADYALSLFPNLPRTLVAFVILTVFYIVNIFGVDKMAKVQNAIVGIMIVALFVFVGCGILRISPDYFTQDFITHGTPGIFQAMAILLFAVNGAFVVSGLSGEAKNPTRDIPIAIIVGTLAVAVLYALMGVVASGVLPVAQVANQPLTVVAKEIMPPILYVLFVLGGAMFALVSTLNAQFASVPKSILQGCVDGWLPEKIAYLHPKYKTPVVILTFFYLIGLLPIFAGLDIEEIASMASLLTQVCSVLINLCILRLPKVLPEAWAKSRYKMSQGMLTFFVVLCTLLGLFNVVALASTMTLPLIIGNGVVLVIGLIYVVLRLRSGKVHMEISYEVE